MPANVFISYNSKDADAASGLENALRQTGLGAFAFLTRPTLPGDDYTRQIGFVLAGAHYFVLLWSEASSASSDVHAEIEVARARRIPVIPIRLDPISLPDIVGRTQAIEAHNHRGRWYGEAAHVIHAHLQRDMLQGRFAPRPMQSPRLQGRSMLGGLLKAAGIGLVAAWASEASRKAREKEKR